MSEVIPYQATFPSGQQVLVERHFSDDGYEFMTVALRGARADTWGAPENLELAPSSKTPEVPIGPEVPT